MDIRVRVHFALFFGKLGSFWVLQYRQHLAEVYSTHQKWMKFAFIVTCSIFLQSYWVLNNVMRHIIDRICMQLGIHLPLSPGQVDSSSPARCCAQNTSFTNPSGRAFSIFFSRLNRTSLSGSTKYEKSCYKNFIGEPLCNLLFYNWW